jgi:hypothetical protein
MSFALPFDQMNRAGELLAQARGIAAVVGAAAPNEGELPVGAISNACWAIQELLDQVEKITSLQSEVTP